MPKLDPTRNYYADLEVSPTASVDEIKKQFRKLGKCSRLLRASSRNDGEIAVYYSRPLIVATFPQHSNIIRTATLVGKLK